MTASASASYWLSPVHQTGGRVSVRVGVRVRIRVRFRVRVRVRVRFRVRVTCPPNRGAVVGGVFGVGAAEHHCTHSRPLFLVVARHDTGEDILAPGRVVDGV